ncbi:MAG: citramalate synthase, partial [Candidatus Delongbacteria bacterium]|nr:citramalate synthase [Candidatus Delongbacteria bacterium]
MKPSVELYDTTLRDGCQAEGISLSCNDKLRIARRLDEFGIPYIEGGWPGSNPKDAEFFARRPELMLKQAKIVAFGSTRHKDKDCDHDANIQKLVESNTPAVTVFGKSWDLHVDRILETGLDTNLEMIRDTIRYLKDRGREVIYDAEHFFDGYKANPEYSIQTLRAAAEGGADGLTLCDTNGGSLPSEVFRITTEVVRWFPALRIGIHAHNDAELAVAVSLAAVEAGAGLVQGTINGYGERVGNANLISLIPALQLKMGKRCVSSGQLRELRQLSHFVNETANMAPNPHQPYVGTSAFAHKGGVHVSAVLKVEHSYQHIDPGLVGNEMKALVSEMAGRQNIRYKAEQLGIAIDSETTRRVLEQIKHMENQGYSFESADASVSLMLRRASADYTPPFEVIDFMVVIEDRRGPDVFSEATVKVKVGDQLLHTVADGNGPVDALNAA